MSDIIERRPLVHELTEIAGNYAAASRSANSSRAYGSQWKQFVQWCDAEGLDPFSGEPTIALNITSMAQVGLTVSTIMVRLSAIQSEYAAADVPLNTSDPVLARVLEGIRRTVGTAARRKATPIGVDSLRAMLATREAFTHPRGARDRLLLLLGFGGALRRSELAALQIGDVAEVPGKGLHVTIRRSKGDQAGAGAPVYVSANPLEAAFCPVVAWRRWMAHRAAAEDMGAFVADRGKRPLLCSVDKSRTLSGQALSDKTVLRVVKDAAEAAGMDPTAVSGHSLRRGLLTAAAEEGADLKALMLHGRHRNADVALGYIQEANAWTNNASARVFGG